MFYRKSLYEQVYDRLAKDIATGKYPVGCVLPNEVELAKSFKLSAGTMRKALDRLERARVVSRIQGRGTTVTAKTPAKVCRHCDGTGYVQPVNGNGSGEHT
jgi:GntR family transcriptional regulator